MRYVMGIALGVAGTVAALVWLRRRFVAVTVVGVSMEPTLHAGQRLLARRAAGATGDVVVVRSPGADPSLLVKRLAACGGEPLPAVLGDGLVPEGWIAVLGDNPHRSMDSRHFGLLPASSVVAVIGSVPPRVE